MKNRTPIKNCETWFMCDDYCARCKRMDNVYLSPKEQLIWDTLTTYAARHGLPGTDNEKMERIMRFILKERCPSWIDLKAMSRSGSSRRLKMCLDFSPKYRACATQRLCKAKNVSCSDSCEEFVAVGV